MLESTTAPRQGKWMDKLKTKVESGRSYTPMRERKLPHSWKLWLEVVHDSGGFIPCWLTDPVSVWWRIPNPSSPLQGHEGTN